jgi:hypothetical protein
MTIVGVLRPFHPREPPADTTACWPPHRNQGTAHGPLRDGSNARR